MEELLNIRLSINELDAILDCLEEYEHLGGIMNEDQENIFKRLQEIYSNEVVKR